MSFISRLTGLRLVGNLSRHFIVIQVAFSRSHLYKYFSECNRIYFALEIKRKFRNKARVKQEVKNKCGKAFCHTQYKDAIFCA